MTKGFFARWFEGMKNLSPQRQLEANIAFDWGNIFGFFGGFVTMLAWVIMTGQYQYWWTVLILLIAFLVTIYSLIAKYQQKKAFEGADEQINKLDELRIDIK